jgi:signal transduction histidine kinase/ligand-binding sensor domain-containing protein
MYFPKHLCTFVLVQFLSLTIYGQSHYLTNQFRQENGLPSNHIYDICEDLDGFLWIATANGISRFDGKKFFNYTTRQGLPSNDVLQVGIDKDGTLWVSCYKQPPSYFDRKKNKFVTVLDQAVLNISNQLLFLCFDDQRRAIFRGSSNLIQFDFDKKYQVESIEYFFKFKQDGVNLKYRNEIIVDKGQKAKIDILNFKNEIVASRTWSFNDRVVYWGALTNYLDVFIDQKVYYRLRYNQAERSIDVVDSIVFEQPIKYFNLKNNVLSFVSSDGSVLSYDVDNFRFIHKMAVKTNVNISYRDKYGNFWIGTLDDGLLLFTNSKIINPKLPESYFLNTLSICVNQGKIMIGNHNGQILTATVDGGNLLNQKVRSFNQPFWIRAVMFMNNNDEFSISDNLIASQKIAIQPSKDKRNSLISIKTGLRLNEKQLIIGSISGLMIFNTTSNEYDFMNGSQERILSLARLNDSTFYFVASEGVYEYQMSTNQTKLVFANSNLVHERIDKIEVLKNGNICFSTYVGKIYFLNNRYDVVASYGAEIGLPENLKMLKDLDGKTLWIATNSGIYGVDYTDFDKAKVTHYSLSDGLISNEINAIDIYDNVLYAATNRGLSIIPLNGGSRRWPISPKIISIRIDGIDLPIQSKYELEPEETMVNIQFSGVELYGHFSKFQYLLDDETWDDMDGTVLNLQLRPGKNIIKVRAVDDCNRVGEEILLLEFNVRIPFYNRTWFWVLIVNLFVFLALGMRYRYKIEQQKIIFEKQLILRKQREKITADLHDEIGSTLSSLQINSAVSNKLINTNIDKSKALLKTIEKQAKDLSEKIGDIIWSLKPEDEFMSLSTRITNFAVELIGPTEIAYTINIDKRVDELVTDLTMRKNILMICKEALNNAVKYSEAKQVSLNISLIENQLEIEIKDNGIGFILGEKKGNGLTNMKRRTEEINGKLYMESILDKGTTISLKVRLT